MMPPETLHRHLDDERRLNTARRMLTAEKSEPRWRCLSENARLLYAVGLLICDDVGKFTQPALTEAMGDPAVVSAAMVLLFETGAC